MKVTLGTKPRSLSPTDYHLPEEVNLDAENKFNEFGGIKYGPFGHSTAQPRLTQVEHGTALSQRTFILWHSAQAISRLESQDSQHFVAFGLLARINCCRKIPDPIIIR